MAVDRDLVLLKATSVRKHLNRVTERRDIDVEGFFSNIARQERIRY
jgi:hypothetical protein